MFKTCSPSNTAVRKYRTSTRRSTRSTVLYSYALYSYKVQNGARGRNPEIPKFHLLQNTRLPVLVRTVRVAARTAPTTLLLIRVHTQILVAAVSCEGESAKVLVEITLHWREVLVQYCTRTVLVERVKTQVAYEYNTTAREWARGRRDLCDEGGLRLTQTSLTYLIAAIRLPIERNRHAARSR